MTKELRFGEARRWGERIVREAVFSARPAFSLGALCATANAVAGGFTATLGRRVHVVLGEPAHVEPSRWQRLCAGAWAYGIDETTTWLIDRPSASNVLAAILGEPPAMPPTALELRAMDRFMARVWERASAGSRTSEAPKRLREAPSRSWVVDIRVGGALRATLVIGGSLPAGAPPGPFLGARALGAVPVDVYVELASGSLVARELGSLAVGDVVRMATKVRDSAMLKVDDVTIAYGEYGEIEGERGCAARPAFLIRENVR